MGYCFCLCKTVKELVSGVKKYINAEKLGKGIVKAVKKRLQHKNSKVQLLTLTLLETIVTGDCVHFQIAGRNILQEMIKIIKKKRSGVEFPQRSHDTFPIFTPPVTHPTPRQPQAGYGIPNNSLVRIDEAMATETENLSLSSINSMRDIADLLAEMLRSLNSNDRLGLELNDNLQSLLAKHNAIASGSPLPVRIAHVTP